MGSFHVLYLCFLLTGTSVRGSSLPTSSSSDDTNLDSLENSRDVILMELLRRVKLLEARATLIDTVEQNQQTQFESLHNLIKRQEDWIRKKADNTTSNGVRKCDEEETVAQLSSPEAFTAYLDHDMTLSDGQAIVFNKIILNDGDAYNPLSGYFTAPRSGLYDFFFSVGQRDVNNLRAMLFVNGEHMISAASDTYHSTQDLQGTNRGLFRLQEGDVVSVKNAAALRIEGSTDLRISTFSGVLLLE